jgi:hypothetical protein
MPRRNRFRRAFNRATGRLRQGLGAAADAVGGFFGGRTRR